MDDCIEPLGRVYIGVELPNISLTDLPSKKTGISVVIQLKDNQHCQQIYVSALQHLPLFRLRRLADVSYASLNPCGNVSRLRGDCFWAGPLTGGFSAVSCSFLGFHDFWFCFSLFSSVLSFFMIFF
jgi:hypothetical protein